MFLPAQKRQCFEHCWRGEFYHILESCNNKYIYIYIGCRRILLKEQFFVFVILKAFFWPAKKWAHKTKILQVNFDIFCNIVLCPFCINSHTLSARKASVWEKTLFKVTWLLSFSFCLHLLVTGKNIFACIHESKLELFHHSTSYFIAKMFVSLTCYTNKAQSESLCYFSLH